MKKLLLLAGLLWSAIASAQFTPGQVLTAAELNSQFALYAPLTGASFTGPVSGTTGSFSGLVSASGLTATGTLSFPLASLPLPYLATQAANTIVANATGSVATLTAVAAPSCSTSSSALQWASGTGLACNTAIAASTATTAINSTQLGGVAAASYLLSTTAASTYAPSASPSFTSGVTVASGGLGITGGLVMVSGAITPVSTSGISGTTTNNNAVAGAVGEYLTGTAAGTSITSTITANAASVPLTAGDYDVVCSPTFAPAAGTLPTILEAGISTTSATLPGVNTGGFNVLAATMPASAAQVFSSPLVRVSLASSGTVFCVVNSTFTVSTMTVNGFIRARRIR